MLTHHTDDPLMQLLVDRSRRATTAGPELASVHRSIGNLLAADVARVLPLEPCSIEHPTGPATGVRIATVHQPVIVALLRAGLFVAEGVWERLPGSALLLHGTGLPPLTRLDDRPTVIVDSVINTGQTIAALLDEVAQRRPGRMMVLSLVAYRPTVERMAEAMPDVHFVSARLSDRSYVGKGRTDTGSRLFGTAG